MILQRVSVLIAVIGFISAIVCLVQGQWSDAVGSVFYSIAILMVGSVAKKDYESRMRRRARL